jgi:hydrogenase/urease accessory protein HupE
VTRSAFVAELLLATAATSGPTVAHELGAVQVRAHFDRENRFELRVTVDRAHLPPDLRGSATFRESLIDAVVPSIDGIRIARASDWTTTVDTSVVDGFVLTAAGTIPDRARAFDVAIDVPVGSIYVACLGPEGEESAQWVSPGTRSRPCTIGGAAQASVPPRVWPVARQYAWLGLTHIVPGGADHILFVLGLCLLARGLRPLLAQVTAFTLAHSVSLGLAAAKIVTLPSRWVEPLIAASIVCIALENVFAERVTMRRTALVFAFGLLHGLGFAGVLRELGLPNGRFLTALVSFNCGVEAGQLLVIAAAFALVGWWTTRRSWYRPWVVVPASLAIAAVGAVWTIERLVS